MRREHKGCEATGIAELWWQESVGTLVAIGMKESECCGPFQHLAACRRYMLRH